ncbi:hypothetical protein H5410_056744 [Solanum commersonii]|uniref:Uncharacterized protein n=1 Tax=Solanum commersonii TaxID=4109 RepID=A0A9J5WM69_SOLCO|nr:hypothetical protein H5410_056744 [Solanum commersonii]
MKIKVKVKTFLSTTFKHLLNSKSLYDVDENIDDLSDLDGEFDRARHPNIQEQFEDINKNNMRRYEGKLCGNGLYFDSLDLGCDISEDEGEHVESDKVVDPPARNPSTKLYMMFVNNVKFREALQTYCS